jgi:hypothetical protein
MEEGGPGPRWSGSPRFEEHIPMSQEERKRVLDLIAAGKISAEEGRRLIVALEGGASEAGPIPSGSQSRTLRVNVRDVETGQLVTNVRLPVELLGVAMRLAHRLGLDPESEELEAGLERLIEILAGKSLGLVEALESEAGKRIEIVIE